MQSLMDKMIYKCLKFEKNALDLTNQNGPALA